MLKVIYDGFQQLKDESDMCNFYYEVYIRVCVDWVVGMNVLWVYSILLKKYGMLDVFLVGCVQMLIFVLIVKCEKEIDNFKLEFFWEVFVKFDIEGKKYEGKWY